MKLLRISSISLILILNSCFPTVNRSFTMHEGLMVDDEIPRHHPSFDANITKSEALDFLSAVLDKPKEDIHLSQDEIILQGIDQSKLEIWKLSELFKEEIVYLGTPLPKADKDGFYVASIMNIDHLKKGAQFNNKHFPALVMSMLYGIQVEGFGQQEALSNSKKVADILYTAYISNFERIEQADSTIKPNSKNYFTHELQKLKDLHDKELITDEEYNQKRKEILKSF